MSNTDRPRYWSLAAVLLIFGVASYGPAAVMQAIIPAAVPVANKTGTAARFVTSAAAGTSGNCAQWGASGDLTDAGAVCGGGGGGAGVLLSGTSDPGVPTVTPVQGAASVAVQTLAFGSSVTSGNCLVLVAGWQNGTGVTLDTVTDTLGTTFAATSGGTEVAGMHGTIYVGKATASGADTITWTKASSTAQVTAIGEFTGTTCVVDTSAALNASQPSVTTTVAYDELINGYLVHSNTNTCGTTGTGICYKGATGNNSVELGYQPTSATPGANTATLTSSFPTNTVFVTVALEPSAVASPGVDGNWYVNTTTGVLWGPKTAGVWGKSNMAWLSQTGANAQFVLTGSPSVMTCGSTPSATLATGASNNAGTINVGGGTVTACTLNFSPAFTNAPSCHFETGTAAITGSLSAVGVGSVTFNTSASVGGGKIYYQCF